MWHPIDPFWHSILSNSVISYFFCRLSVSHLFPFLRGRCPSSRRICVPKYVCPFCLWCTVLMLVLFDILFFFFFVNAWWVVECPCIALVDSHWSSLWVMCLLSPSTVQLPHLWHFLLHMVLTSAFWVFPSVEGIYYHTSTLSLLPWNFSFWYVYHSKICPLISKLLCGIFLEFYLLPCSSTELAFLVLCLVISCS
jgi:hypothetical protein